MFIVDTTSPTISLNGASILSIIIWSQWVDHGASWSDIVDGNWIITITSWSVNTNLMGEYIVEYYYTDMAWNKSNTVRRIIYVKKEMSDNNWGGGYTLDQDLCPNWDKSPSYHDGVCEKEKKVDQTIFNSSIGNVCYTPRDIEILDPDDNTSQQFKIAHQMLYSYGLTKWKGTLDYRPTDYITRQEAAKFMVQFAQNVLCREKTRTYDENFSDLGISDVTLIKFIRDSYEYNIFNGDKNGTFRPTDRISTDELAAIMIRLITNTFLEEPKDEWAREYKEMLNLYSKNSSLHNAQRDTIGIVMFDLYRNNTYVLQNIGYIIKLK